MKGIHSSAKQSKAFFFHESSSAYETPFTLHNGERYLRWVSRLGSSYAFPFWRLLLTTEGTPPHSILHRYGINHFINDTSFEVQEKGLILIYIKRCSCEAHGCRIVHGPPSIVSLFFSTHYPGFLFNYYKAPCELLLLPHILRVLDELPIVALTLTSRRQPRRAKGEEGRKKATTTWRWKMSHFTYLPKLTRLFLPLLLLAIF